MSKGSGSSVNESAGMELTPRGGRSFIEVIYLNPQCLLEHHENSSGKKVRCSGAAYPCAACPCTPLYQLCVGQLY